MFYFEKKNKFNTVIFSTSGMIFDNLIQYLF